ncbi:hypothetical protein CLOM_g5636 [Closterium sp. NIES-68]|nr:hypothetical protein CLOM_g5636 [Closterium sp. NIES-68]GJP63986.1 hypothetical protein CLOP_g21026 [Closterium sp. NIES-67]
MALLLGPAVPHASAPVPSRSPVRGAPYTPRGTTRTARFSIPPYSPLRIISHTAGKTPLSSAHASRFLTSRVNKGLLGPAFARPGEASHASGRLRYRRSAAATRVNAVNEVNAVNAVNASEVEARIAVAGNTGALDLSDCGLSAIPAAVLRLSSLTDLSLAGNQIASIPSEIGNLSKLRRLGLAGNRLQQLPPEIGQLTDLEGLWLHGNLLQELPNEIGRLTALRFLALAGNQLTWLPETVGRLKALQVLSVAGNQLQELPQTIGSLTSLRVLAAYGNRLTSLPPSITHLTALQELFLQGNRISSLPPLALSSLRQLSLADNCLSAIPQGTLSQLPSLDSLWLYGNSISHLPSDSAQCPRLANLWLEGNPLTLSHAFLSDSCHHIKTVGIDSLQLPPLEQPLPSNVLVSRLAGTGAARQDGGYFKVQPWQRVSSPSEAEAHRSGVLVVAFGSAPAVPNWAGLLRKVKGDMALSKAVGGITTPFDTLYVVDSTRSWYTHAPLSTVTPKAADSNLPPPPPPTLSHVGDLPQAHFSHPSVSSTPTSWPMDDPSLLSQSPLLSNTLSDSVQCGAGTGDCSDGGYYRMEIAAAVEGYDRVVMIGDSMGASAALMFSEFASSVLAFCPQVDLISASIRPGRDPAWLRSFTQNLLSSLESCFTTETISNSSSSQLPTHVHVHCGNWSHDVAQARLVEHLPQVEVTVHPVDSHRLAKDLDSNGRLVPLVKAALR